MPQAHQQPEQYNWHGQPHRRPTYATEVAQQPEQDAARLLGGGRHGDEEGGKGVEQLRAGDPGKDHLGIVAAWPRSAGQHQH
ncbi:hypothetical protein D3C86_1888770 [compost metagenome]